MVQSNQALGLLATLQIEMNMYKSSSKNYAKNQNSTNYDNIEKLFRLIDSRFKRQIGSDDFLNLYNDWNKINNSLLSSSKFFDTSQRKQYTSDELIYVLKKFYMTDEENLRFLIYAVKIIHSYTNFFLTSTPCIGTNSSGKKISKLTFDIISLLEEVYYTFDYRDFGHIEIDQIFFFYIAILETTDDPYFQGISISELDANLYKFLVNLGCTEGKISMRQFKKFLLSNNFHTVDSLKLLKKSSKKIIKLAQEFNELATGNFSIIIPNLITISLVYNIVGINLTDIKKNSPAHYFLQNFVPYCYDNFHLRGLLIQNPDSLIEIICKNFLDYYPSDIQKNIRWDYDIINLFTGIIKTYDQLSKKLLKKGLEFLSKHKSTKKDTSRTNLFEIFPENPVPFGNKAEDMVTFSKPDQYPESTQRKRSLSPVLDQINRGFDEILHKYMISSRTPSPKPTKSARVEQKNISPELFKSKFDLKVQKKNQDNENSPKLHAYTETSYRTPSPKKYHRLYNNQKPENNNFVGNKHFATIDRKIQSNQTHREKENELVLQSQQLEKNKSLTSMKKNRSRPNMNENIRYGPKVESFEEVMRKLTDGKLISPIQLAQQKKTFGNS